MLAALLLVLAGASTGFDAGAQEPEAGASAQVTKANQDLARSVAVTGREAFNAGDYETALALFRRAYTLFPAPTVVLYEARSLEKMGRLLEALEAYGRTTQIAVDSGAPAQFAEAVTAAREEARELATRVPTLTLQVQGVSGHDPNLKLEINGRAIGAAQLGQALNLDPGTYRVLGSVSPDQRDERQAVLVKGSNITVVLDLVAPVAKAPIPDENDAMAVSMDTSSSGVSPLVYVAGAVGIVGVGAGVVTGVVASSKHSKAETQCPDMLCQPGSPGVANVNSFRTLRMVSTVSYGVGAVGIAAGVVLWLTADSSPETDTAALEPWFTNDTAGVRGSF